MSFRFIGESLPELRAYAPADRRGVYLRACRASYRSWKTWLGLFAFVATVVSGDPAVRALAGLLCLGSLQLWAIQDALRSTEANAAPNGGPAASADNSGVVKEPPSVNRSFDKVMADPRSRPIKWFAILGFGVALVIGSMPILLLERSTDSTSLAVSQLLSISIVGTLLGALVGVIVWLLRR